MGNETRIARIVRAALEFQDELIKKLPQEKIAGIGERCGRLIVDDPTGKEATVMYFMVSNGRLAILDQKPEPERIRNEVIFWGIPERNYSGVDVFIDTFKRKGFARSAYASGYIVINGELASYDSEEMLQLLEDWMDKVSGYLGFR